MNERHFEPETIGFRCQEVFCKWFWLYEKKNKSLRYEQKKNIKKIEGEWQRTVKMQEEKGQKKMEKEDSEQEQNNAATNSQKVSQAFFGSRSKIEEPLLLVEPFGERARGSV